MSDSYTWIDTPLRRPGTALVAGVGGAFTVIGLGLLAWWRARTKALPDDVDLLTRAGFEAHGDVWVLAILGCGFAGLGGAALVLALRNAVAPGSVRHVADAAVPDVPPRPLLPADADTRAGASHRLAAGRLEPDPRVLSGKRRFVFAFAVAFGAFCFWLLMTLRPISGSAAPNAVVGVFAVVALTTAVLIFDYVLRSIARRLVTLDFSDRRTFRVTQQGEELAGGDRDDLVAVQIAAARHRVQHGSRTTTTDALELNLAFRDAEGAVERVNLMRTNGAFARLADLAARLAEQLDLPLLYHATDRHWQVEKQRSRERRPGHGSISG